MGGITTPAQFALAPANVVAAVAGQALAPASVAATGALTGASLTTTLGGVNTSGNVDVTLAGDGLRVAEGANAKQGVATLVAGSVTVATTAVTANSRIAVNCQTLGTVAVASAFDTTTRVVGTSFTIHASQGTDTSTVFWEIFEPG